MMQEFSQSRYGRKLLQTNSSSSFDSSQPSFIALLCIISVLTTILVITIIILCYRYYSHREQKLKTRYKSRKKFKPILPIQTNQQSPVPILATPTSASSYSVRSSEQLFSELQQTSSINTLPSRRIQQPMIDAYLNDLNTFQPTTLDVQQLKSYLFIDLHSTSSETFPDNASKTTNTITSGYNTSTENQSQKKNRYYFKQPRKYQRTLNLKKTYTSRFLMRERSLPNNLQILPQLRQMITQQQRTNDSNDSSTTIMNDDLQSTNISTTTDDYDDSHAYHVNQQQVIQTIKEDKRPYSSEFHYEQEPYLFEIVSTSRGDDSDLQMPYKSVPIRNNGLAYINDSIIV